MNDENYAGAVAIPSAPEGPYQVWLYMLDTSSSGTTNENNTLQGVFMYDTHDAWDVSNPTAETGNRVTYTVDEVTADRPSWNDISSILPGTDASLTGLNEWSWGEAVYINNTAVSETVPVIKFGNVDASVKYILINFFRADSSFNFRLEIRTTNGDVITSFTDDTRSALTGNNVGYQTTMGIQMSHTGGGYGEWNIPALYDVSNMTIPKVLDLNNTIHDSTAVNYANVYLYGTDGNTANDALAVKTINPAIASSVPWNASAKHWRVHVLTYLFDSAAPVKQNTDYTGRTRVTEMNFNRADGVYTNITLQSVVVNEITHSNNNTLHDNTYNPDSSQRFNGSHIDPEPQFSTLLTPKSNRWKPSI